MDGTEGVLPLGEITIDGQIDQETIAGLQYMLTSLVDYDSLVRCEA